jgi:RNA polymerase sigma-70 factor (ECF subfamily)
VTYATGHGCHSGSRPEADGVLVVRVEDAITGLCYVRNPGKLTRLTSEIPLIPR